VNGVRIPELSCCSLTWSIGHVRNGFQLLRLRDDFHKKKNADWTGCAPQRHPSFDVRSRRSLLASACQLPAPSCAATSASQKSASCGALCAVRHLLQQTITQHASVIVAFNVSCCFAAATKLLLRSYASSLTHKFFFASGSTGSTACPAVLVERWLLFCSAFMSCKEKLRVPRDVCDGEPSMSV
jgi:hypothetical protein